MSKKVTGALIAGVIFLLFFGFAPQYIYNNFFKPGSYTDEIEINWEELYPTNESLATQTQLAAPKKEKKKLIDLYTGLVNKVETRLDDELNKNFPFRTKFIELNGAIIHTLGQKFITGSDNVVEIDDGSLTIIEEKKDVRKEAIVINEFYEWLKRQNTDFIYVLCPAKVKAGTEEIQGYQDFSNENSDEFLKRLNKNIDKVDLRKDFQHIDNYLSHFYLTDHHWRPETGLQAAGFIARKLNSEYDFDIDLDLFNIDNYNCEVYEDWLLGSAGKKVTLGFTRPEDLNIYFPKFPTELKVEVPSLGISKTGSFYSTLIYKRYLQELNYYDWDVYGTYGYGNRAIITIDNQKINDGSSVLIIKDSFANTVAPFLSLGVDKMTILDPRHFTGSVKEYIKQNPHDVVIFMQNPSTFVTTDNISGSLFDLE